MRDQLLRKCRGKLFEEALLSSQSRWGFSCNQSLTKTFLKFCKYLSVSCSTFPIFSQIGELRDCNCKDWVSLRLMQNCQHFLKTSWRSYQVPKQDGSDGVQSSGREKFRKIKSEASILYDIDSIRLRDYNLKDICRFFHPFTLFKDGFASKNSAWEKMRVCKWKWCRVWLVIEKINSWQMTVVLLLMFVVMTMGLPTLKDKMMMMMMMMPVQPLKGKADKGRQANE